MSTRNTPDARQRFAPTRGGRCLRTALLALSLPAVWGTGIGSDPDKGAGGDVPLSPVVATLFRAGISPESDDYLARVATVAFDDSGHLYALDFDRYLVLVWNREGDLIRQLGGYGEGPGVLEFPEFAVTLGDGTVAVLDRVRRSFSVFDPQGRYDRSVAMRRGAMPGSRAVAVADWELVGPDQPWATSGYDDREVRPLYSYSLRGDAVTSELLFNASWSPQADEIDAFWPPLLVASFSDGRIAVADSEAYRVKVLRNGVVEHTLGREIDPFPTTELAMEAERTRRSEDPAATTWARYHPTDCACPRRSVRTA